MKRLICTFRDLRIDTETRRNFNMKHNRRISLYWLLLFFLLAALPALACSTITGSDEDEAAEVVVEATVVAEAEPVEAPTQEPEAPPTDAPEVSPTEEPTAVPAEDTGEGEALEGDSLADIFGAQRSGLEVDALRIHMISEDSTTNETSETIIEFVKPDRFHMASEGFELIVIGETTYIKDESGVWIESPIAMGDMFGETISAFTDEESVSQLIDDLQVSITDLQYLGEETVNGNKTKVYEYSADDAFGGTTVFTTVWIGVDDGLMYRQVMAGETLEDQGTLTFEYEYGEDVSIEAPIE
jgi:outer membrane lipoprotein-sorting protein